MAFQVEWIIRARDEFSKVAKSVSESMDGINDKIKETARSIKEGPAINRLLESLGSAFMRNVTLPLAAIGGESLNSARKFQNFQSVFSSWLGSSKQADSYLYGLQEMTRSLGIDFFDAAAGAQTLLNSGMKLKDINPMVKAIGALSKGTASSFQNIADAIESVRSEGFFTERDLKRFGTLGINITPELAKLAHMSPESLINRLHHDGRLSLPDFTYLLEQIAKSPQFINQLKNSNKTLTGSFQILKNSVDDASLSLGRQIIKTFNLSGNMARFAKVIDDVNKKFISGNPSMVHHAIIWGSIAAAIGPAVLALGMAVKVFRLLFILPFKFFYSEVMLLCKSFRFLAIVMRFAFTSPIGLILMAVTALVIFFATTKTGRHVFKLMADAIISGFKAIVNFAKLVGKSWEKTLNSIEDKYQKLKNKFHFGKPNEMVSLSTPQTVLMRNDQAMAMASPANSLKAPIPVSQIYNNNLNASAGAHSKVRVDINVSKAPGLTVDVKSLQQASKNVSYNVGKNLFGSGTA